MAYPCERCQYPLDSPACSWCFFNPDVIDSMVEAMCAFRSDCNTDSGSQDAQR